MARMAAIKKVLSPISEIRITVKLATNACHRVRVDVEDGVAVAVELELIVANEEVDGATAMGEEVEDIEEESTGLALTALDGENEIKGSLDRR